MLVRLTGADRDRLRRTAARDYLEMSTWARRAILQALDRADVETAGPGASPGTTPAGNAGNGKGDAHSAAGGGGSEDDAQRHRSRGPADAPG